MTNVLLYQGQNNGEINIENGLIETSGGLETAAYLSLFGGNENDNGLIDSVQWWGNSLETENSKIYKSETQYLLRSIPAIPANLRRIEEAASRDLQWLLDENIANVITVEASIPDVNKVNINVDIQAIGEESEFEFVENWKIES